MSRNVLNKKERNDDGYDEITNDIVARFWVHVPFAAGTATVTAHKLELALDMS